MDLAGEGRSPACFNWPSAFQNAGFSCVDAGIQNPTRRKKKKRNMSLIND